jgi:hypothetical protein
MFNILYSLHRDCTVNLHESKVNVFKPEVNLRQLRPPAPDKKRQNISNISVKQRKIRLKLNDLDHQIYFGNCPILLWWTVQCVITFAYLLGANAIWISPIVENTPKGYHGYWAKDIYSINPHFGSEKDLQFLITECHRRDIWVMVDV